jgi:hypothetical protein
MKRNLRIFFERIAQLKEIHRAVESNVADGEDVELPLELAEAFEDIGNLFLGVSEDIRQKFISARNRAAIPPNFRSDTLAFAQTHSKAMTAS